jgi:hypothetical protein
MILTHAAGTVGGATWAGTSVIISATVHASSTPWFELALAGSGVVGALVAIASFLTGVRRDPKAALAAHADLDDLRALALDKRLSDIDGKVDTLVLHFLGEHLNLPKETP